MVTTNTRQLALRGRRGFELQQCGQGCGTGLVEGRPQSGLYGFQIGPTTFLALRKDTAEELVYFPRNLLMDCSSRFFSCSVQPPRSCATGRR